MINIIVAVSENNVIGNNNELVWDIPEDLRKFKFLTIGNTVIMGRKTYDSIGKPLSKRQNIVITRKENVNCKDCLIVNSLHDAIYKSDNRTEIFIIGGGEIYKEALHLDVVDRIYLTRIHHEFEGDTKFHYPKELFEVVDKDNRNGEFYEYSYIVLDRNKQ